jgi:hypothetical protein
LDSSREGAPGSVVVAQIRGWDAGRLQLSVRNKFAEGEALELVTPSGARDLTATGLVNHRGEGVAVLNSGMEDCSVECASPPPPWSFLVRHAAST